MSLSTPSMRPLGRWKGLLRRARQVKLSQRPLSTNSRPAPSRLPPPSIAHSIEHSIAHKRIKTYPPPPSQLATLPSKDAVAHVTALQLRTLDPTGARTALFSRTNREGAKVGDVLLVRLKNGDPFAGTCLNIRRRGVDSGILLRNTLTRVGVEMWFKIYSPNVEAVEVVQRRAKRARRARLYYMRKPEHDPGSVQGIVQQYQRQRAMLRSGERAAGSDGKAKKGKRR